MKKKSGRPQNSEIERLRPKFWYWYIKSLTDLNDSQLDVLFAEDEEGNKYSISDRPRIFESIRLRGTTPSEGDHPRRKYNLIDKVDADPRFKGSKNIITSPFWDLLDSSPHDSDRNTKILNELFKRLNLTRFDYTDKFFWDFMAAPAEQKDRNGISRHFISDFEHNFNHAISFIPDNLDLMALVGALYRESCLSFQLENAIVLSKYFEMFADGCLNTEWKNPSGALLWNIAHERILYGNHKYVSSMSDKDNVYKNLPKSFGVIVNKSDQRYINRFES